MARQLGLDSACNAREVIVAPLHPIHPKSVLAEKPRDIAEVPVIESPVMRVRDKRCGAIGVDGIRRRNQALRIQEIPEIEVLFIRLLVQQGIHLESRLAGRIHVTADSLEEKEKDSVGVVAGLNDVEFESDGIPGPFLLKYKVPD